MGTRAGRRARRGALATGMIFAVTATTVSLAPGTASAAPVTPPGMSVLLESGAWSWFEDERAIVDFAGNRLYVSAVADSPTPGEVVVGEVDMTNGNRQVVSLGQSRLDDHNSAAIWESDIGEVLTAWSSHAENPVINTHRRRTDSSWLRLPWVVDDANVTYNNLYSVLSENGDALLYDFFRGSGNDPEAMASNDGGRTWSALGRLLRDPTDDGNRPYLRYASRGERIDLIATEEHPDVDGRTSIYHGFIRDGIVHTSTGVALGPVGSAISVTSLTRVWQATAAEEGWTVDVGYDPVTRHPIAAFSTIRTADDHRYYIGRWDGSTWQTREVAYAGTALYSSQRNYTGLVALDPRDGNHVVISTDADPVTGAPLVSATDGQRHHELYDGWRQPDGSYAWTALTADSDVDNIRPVITTSASGAWALAWLRGRYTTYQDYDLQVVGVLRRPDGSTVATSPTAPRRPVVLGISDPGPLAATAVPLTGRYDSHPAADLMLYRPGADRDDLIVGDNGRHPIHAQPRGVSGTYRPATGDFDLDGDSDILWHAPGTGADTMWLARPDGTFEVRTVPAVNGTYTPIPGDFDGDGDTDIFWYAPGAGGDPEFLWLAGPGATWTFAGAPAVNGTFTPIPGNFDGDGDTDIFWYVPGTGQDHVWLAGPGGTWASRPVTVNGAYTPVPGNYDGDGDTDIVFYAPGSGGDYLWTTGPDATWTSQPTSPVSGTYRPTSGDFDADGADDILWYRAGADADHIWYHDATGPLGAMHQLPLNL